MIFFQFIKDFRNEGQNLWHETNCSRFYRCFNGKAIEFTCPHISRYFDSCLLICINNPNAICGDPGNQCGVLETTTVPQTIPTTDGIPSAPSECLSNHLVENCNIDFLFTCSCPTISTNCSNTRFLTKYQNYFI